MLISQVLMAAGITLAPPVPADPPQPVAAGAPAVAPTDWPQWRGPSRNGISAETEWSSRGRTLWKANVGLGYSTFAVGGNRVYTQGWDNSQDTVFCFDAASGDVIWKHSYECGKWDQFHGGGTNCTPSLDGDRLYVSNREGRFLCLDARDGRVEFAKDLKDEYGLGIPTWGFAASPLVLDEMVIVNVGRVMAFDKKGKLLWKSEDMGHAYSTPVDFEFRGKPALAVFNGGGVAALDLDSGEDLAAHKWKTSYQVNAATPIPVGNGKVFVSSGYNRGCALIDLAAAEPAIAWEKRVMRNHMAGCVLLDEHLYGFDENMFKCLDLAGEEKWRLRGVGKGAHCVAGDRLILLSDRGELIVAKAQPDSYEEIAREKVLDGGVCWTVPVISDARIYCRNSLGDIVCRDHRPAAAGN